MLLVGEDDYFENRQTIQHSIVAFSVELQEYSL